MRLPRSLVGSFVVLAGATVACAQDLPTARPALGGTLVFEQDGEAVEIKIPGLLPNEPVLGPVVPLDVNVPMPAGKRSQKRVNARQAYDEGNGVLPVAYSEDDEEDFVILYPGEGVLGEPGFGHAPPTTPIGKVPREPHYALPGQDTPNPLISLFPLRVIGQPMPAPTGEPFYTPVLPPIHPDQIQSHLSAAAAQLEMAGLNAESQRIQEFQQQFQRDHAQRLLIAFKEFQLKMLQEEIAILKQQPPAPSPITDIVIEAKAIKVR